MTMFGSQWLANAGSTYEIEQSIRFNSADDAKLSRTPDSDGSTTTFTISVWVKRSTTTIINSMYQGFSGTSAAGNLRWLADGRLQFYDNDGTGNGLLTTALFRDPASWYHIVAIWDTSNATSTDRLRLYSNGDRITSFDSSTFPAVNYATTYFNRSAYEQQIGFTSSGSTYSDFLLAEYNFIDGTAVEPSSFGKINSDTGQWVPKKYTGAYGTNGFYLKGQDSSALGDDTSGNGNDFSSSGLAANDQLSDSPTNNWCVLNGVSLASTATLSDGNLTLSNTSTGATTCTLATPSSGKWYFEVKFDSQSAATTSQAVGVVKAEEAYSTGTSGGGIYFFSDGGLRIEGSDTGGWGSAWGVGDTIGVAIDLDDDKIWFAIDNTWQASGDPSAGTDPAASGFSSEPYVALIRNGNSSRTTVWTANFGQNAFAYTPPTDFLALNTANLPDPAIEDPSAYFQTTLYEGDGSTQSIDQSENSTFSPNFVWIKNRDATDAHALFDTVRGATEVLSSNSTGAEATNADTLTAFESDGFALGDDVIVNTNAESYVAWQWNEGATPGFDIVSYTGNATARTISHNLGVVPEMMIVKNRADTDNWAVYHSGNTSAPATDYLVLNERDATADDATVWNDTAPTSSVFSVGTSSLTNGNTEAMIAYVFAPVEGFSKFSSYIGNGNAYGPMVNVGFQPAFLLLKSTGDNKWILKDTKRSPFNASSLSLVANNSDAELTGDQPIDINSNGFKLRTTGSGVNSSGVEYVYMAFAEHPFKTANAR